MSSTEDGKEVGMPSSHSGSQPFWGTYRAAKICKLCQRVDKFKRNNYPFGKDSNFQMHCELKIQEVNYI
jgi:hypothetical protein